MEKLLGLLNTLWFEQGVLAERLESSTGSLSSGNEAGSELDRLTLKISHARSLSDPLNISANSILLSDAESPKSVLRQTPRLQTVLSGKEVWIGFGEWMAADEMKVARKMKRTRRRKSRESKSLTELEFEEVKGFMELGFVFSNEYRNDSSLVSVIPGLHRRGHHSGKEDGEYDNHLSGVSRPYLSEAWRCVRKETIPFSVRMGSANEAEMKNYIKFWATQFSGFYYQKL